MELKNLNSISFVRDGIAHEIKRQLAVVAAGGTLVQETRDYDGQTGASQSLRSKEMAHDYRYFPDPDLMPVKVDDAWKARIRAECPELPFDKQRRFFEQYQLPYTLTSVLVPDHALSDYFEEAVKLGGKPQAVGNWIVNDLLRELGLAQLGYSAQIMRDSKRLTEEQITETGTFFSRKSEHPSLANIKIRPAHIAALVGLVEAGTVLNQAAKEIFTEMFTTGEMPDAIAEKRGLKATPTDSNELEQWCRESIAANAEALAEFKAGKDSAINAFKGPVMKAAKGKANPKLVDETLRRLLAGM